MAIITLTTDLGTTDWFVGSMKGVILGLNPEVSIVDITHDVPGDIRAGAFALLASYRCFPRQTVHLAVVDPGVGSDRAAIVARTADYFFVGPDNGVLSLALTQEKILEIHRVDSDVYFRKPVSNTFHGRDIFAPVAARLTQRILVDSLGKILTDFVRLDWPPPEVVDGVSRGQVIYIDRFGNAVTNMGEAAVREITETGGTPVLVLGGRQVGELKRFYQEAAKGQPLVLIGSSGFLEIAVNGGNAARALNLKIGSVVELRSRAG